MNFEEIYKTLRQIRIEKGFSQKALGEKCGLTQQAINRIEQGQRKIDIDLLIRMSDALNVSIFDVLNFNSTIDLANTILKNGTSMNSLEIAEKIAKIAENKYKDKYSLDVRLKVAYDELNNNGKEEAVKRVEELTEIPRYTKPDEPSQE